MLNHFFSQEVTDIVAPIIVVGALVLVIVLLNWLRRDTGFDTIDLHNNLNAGNNDDWDNPHAG